MEEPNDNIDKKIDDPYGVLDLMADCDDEVYESDSPTKEWFDDEDRVEPPEKIEEHQLIDLTTDSSSSNVPLNMAQELPNPNFRMDAKNFFLTYPQCSMTKEECLRRLISMMAHNITGVIVCQENHKDEGTHLHALLLLSKRLHVTSARYFDLGTVHGNYRVARDVKSSINYIKKDGNYVEWGIVPQGTAKTVRHKESISAEIVKDLNNGMTYKQLFAKYESFCVLHGKQLQWLVNEHTNLQVKLKPWLGLLELSYEGSWKQVARWINDNVGKQRPHGQKQLFIYGTTGLGKSWMAMQLKNYFNTYWAPNTEVFWDGLTNETELVVFDEFNTTHTITFLNQFLDGTHMNVKVKGGQFHKTSNPAMIILANHGLRNIYCKADDVVYECLDRRLEQICVTTRCPLEFL